MKVFKLLSPTLMAFVTCVGVTAGSMYVTVSTAVSSVAEAAPASKDEVTQERPGHSRADELLNDVTVQLGEDGSLSGRVSEIDAVTGDLSGAEGTTVSLVSGHGDPLHMTADESGEFRFERLQPGVYKVNARGEAGALSFGIRVVGAFNLDAAARTAVPVSLDVQIDSALAPVRDYAKLKQLAASTAVTAVEASGEFDGEVAARDTDFIRTSTGSSRSGSYLSHGRVTLAADGSYSGQIALLNPVTGHIEQVTDMSVYFILDGQVVGTTTVNPDGSYVQQNLLPGVYSELIAGSDGIGYFALDVVSGMADASSESDTILTSQPIEGGRPPATGLCARADGGLGAGEGPPAEGSSFGGGGAGGWGGLLAGLAGGGLAAAIDDDDGVASPGN